MAAKKKAAAKAKKQDEQQVYNVSDYVVKITEMANVLNEKGILVGPDEDEDYTIEITDEDDWNTLTDKFCDAVEHLDAQDRADEIPDEVVTFYEAEPWRFVDEDYEVEDVVETVEEVEEQEPEPEQEEPPAPAPKAAKKKAGKKKAAPKPEPEPESDSGPADEPEPEPVKEEAAPVKDKPKVKAKPAVKAKSNDNGVPKEKDKDVEKDRYGFKMDSIMHKVALVVEGNKKGVTVNDIKNASWNVRKDAYKAYWMKMVDNGFAEYKDNVIKLIK